MFLIVVIVVLLEVQEMDGFENYIQEVNGQVWHKLGYDLCGKGGFEG